ncbi:MAG: cox cluster protein [Haloglomus sp.]
MTDGPEAGAEAGARAGNREGAVPGDEAWEEADDEVRTLGGKRLILLLYAVVVSIAGLTGFLIGALGIRGLRPVTFLGLVTFQPTATGLAAYGVFTMGLGLGVMLALVVYVSDKYVGDA